MDRNENPDRHDTITRTVRKVLGRRTHDVHLIDDVCQDVLVICWQRECALRDLPSERLERFVVRVTLNEYCSWMRKRKPLEWTDGVEESSTEDDPAQSTEKTEQTLILLSLLDRLPGRYRDIARLHIVEGWTHERIASDKGVPVNSIKTRFRRAKFLLATLVEHYFLN